MPEVTTDPDEAQLSKVAKKMLAMPPHPRPNKAHADMKVGKRYRPVRAGHKPTEPMVVYDILASGDIYRYRLGCDGEIADLIALSK